jgi:hypothetical protein
MSHDFARLQTSCHLLSGFGIGKRDLRHEHSSLSICHITVLRGVLYTKAHVNGFQKTMTPTLTESDSGPACQWTSGFTNFRGTKEGSAVVDIGTDMGVREEKWAVGKGGRRGSTVTFTLVRGQGGRARMPLG